MCMCMGARTYIVIPISDLHRNFTKRINIVKPFMEQYRMIKIEESQKTEGKKIPVLFQNSKFLNLLTTLIDTKLDIVFF